jgi:hypothetical protein
MSHHKIKINETYQSVCATCFAHSNLDNDATSSAAKEASDEGVNTIENCTRTCSVSTYETSCE